MKKNRTERPREHDEIVAGQVLYSMEQAGLVLGRLSRRQVYRLVGTGQLRPTKVGVRSFIHRTEIERFAAKNHPIVKV